MEKSIDEIFCFNCGKPVSNIAVVCPNCGIQLKEFEVSKTTSITVPPKSKTVSVVLAVFFGFWSWLYTYRRDQVKFWIFLSLWLTGIIMYISFSCSIIGETINNPNAYDESTITTGASLFTGVMGILSFTGWLWALVVSAIRPSRFFNNYPNG